MIIPQLKGVEGKASQKYHISEQSRYYENILYIPAQNSHILSVCEFLSSQNYPI